MDKEFTTNYKDVTIKVEQGDIIKGKVNIKDKERLSDFLNDDTGQFIVVKNQYGIVFVNKIRIIWVKRDYETDM